MLSYSPMKTTSSLALAASLLAATSLAETRVEFGGTLRLSDAYISLAPFAYLPNWTSKTSTGGYTAEPDGSYAFTLNLGPQNATLKGRATFTPAPDASSLGTTWSLTPNQPTEVAFLGIQAIFPNTLYAGATALCDGTPVAFPATEPSDPGFFRGKISTLSVRDASGTTRLSLTFPTPTDVLLQDNRRWGGNNVSLRLTIASGALAQDTPYTLSLTLAGPDTARLIPATKTVITAGQDWIPVAVEPSIIPGSALDFSAVVPHDAPAGKYGYAVAKGQNFEFEKLPGVPQRFYGVNFCFGANFVDREAAQRLAKHLARIGYNAVRFHHHDGGLTQGSPDGTTLNPKQIELFDGLAAACIEEGLYLTTDLFVSRNIPYRACGIDRDGNLSNAEAKLLIPFHEGVFQNYLQFARNFLSHVNPFTGRSYAEEPALSWIALINEGNLGNYGPDVFKRYPECSEAWKAWLAAKKAADPAAFAGIPDTIPDNLWASNALGVPEFIAFLREHEERFAKRTTEFLRSELKCRALTANMSSWYFPIAFQYARSEAYDYVDDHFYVDHPTFLERSWSLPSQCPNTNPMLGESMGAQGLVVRRILNRPFTLTEYNYSAPGRFRGVGGIATGAAAALQNWAGLWRFAWSHDSRGVHDPAHKPLAYFDMAGDPLSLAAERASICLFLRRDIPELSSTYAFTLPPDLSLHDAAPQCRANWTWASWYTKVGGLVGASLPDGTLNAGSVKDAFARPSAEVRSTLGATPIGGGALSIDSSRGTFLLNTPRTAGGFAENGTISAGVFSAELHETAATVWASSLDNNPLPTSSRILVTHLTDVQNTGITYADPDHRVLLAWGSTPHLMRNGSARVTLALSEGSFEVYALSTGGTRRHLVPSTYADGKLSFTAAINASPDTATFLYEVVRK